MDAPQTTHGVGELFENGDVPFNPKGVAAKIVQRRGEAMTAWRRFVSCVQALPADQAEHVMASCTGRGKDPAGSPLGLIDVTKQLSFECTVAIGTAMAKHHPAIRTSTILEQIRP